MDELFRWALPTTLGALCLVLWKWFNKIDGKLDLLQNSIADIVVRVAVIEEHLWPRKK